MTPTASAILFHLQSKFPILYVCVCQCSQGAVYTKKKLVLPPACHFEDSIIFRFILTNFYYFISFDCYFCVFFCILLLIWFVLIVHVYLQWSEEQAAQQEEWTSTKLSGSTWWLLRRFELAARTVQWTKRCTLQWHGPQVSMTQGLLEVLLSLIILW